MELIADILLAAGAFGAGLYCFVLARRLKRFTNLEQGVGGAVAVLSSQVEELRKSLESARTAADRSGMALEELTQRGESVAQRLELMMASMHDVIPDDQLETPSVDPETAEPGPDNNGESGADPHPRATPGGLMFFRHEREQVEANQ